MSEAIDRVCIESLQNICTAIFESLIPASLQTKISADPKVTPAKSQFYEC